MRTHDQALHDRINLPRLMKRLEQSIQEADWSKTDPPEREAWIRAYTTLQQIRHARLLLKNVELDNVDPTPAEGRRYQHYKTMLKHLEDYMHQVEQQLTPPVRRPKPILPSIRPPAPKSKSTAPKAAESTSSIAGTTLLSAEAGLSPSMPNVQDLLPASPIVPEPEPEPGPSRSTSRVSTGQSLAAPSSSKITATPTILQNSRALQEELSEQLALMATQLHRNATHFSQSLEKDKSVIETMQEKVEGNFEFMKQERIRLRDFRGKSGSTTCLIMMSAIVVLIAFILMVFIIRLT